MILSTPSSILTARCYIPATLKQKSQIQTPSGPGNVYVGKGQWYIIIFSPTFLTQAIDISILFLVYQVFHHASFTYTRHCSYYGLFHNGISRLILSRTCFVCMLNLWEHSSFLTIFLRRHSPLGLDFIFYFFSYLLNTNKNCICLWFMVYIIYIM